MKNTLLQQEIDTITQQLVTQYQPEKIILFGSAARGDMRKDSDLDFFIVKQSEKRPAYRTQEVYRILRDVDYEYPVDIVVYTPDEMTERIDLGDFFIKRVMNEGKVLYEYEKN